MEHVGNITVENNLCISCGICEAVCYKNCIEFRRKGGQYVPKVDEMECVNCHTCLDVCPGYKVDLNKLYNITKQQKPDDIYVGNHKGCYIANAKNNEIRSSGASGGCITAIVKELLDTGKYDGAFLVDSYKYNEFLQTSFYKKGDALKLTTKSRYVPISHGGMIKYVLRNKDARVIIVATSCAIHGFLNVVSRFNLNRDNYLLLGLFCDKTMNYNVFEYFSCYGKPESRLKNLLFRTKEKGSWPGNVKLEYENGDVKILPAKERIILKDYFQLERCLYCIDKTNQFADISFGDNYTGKNTSEKGSNSVIIRTLRGEEIWSLTKNVLDIQLSSLEDIYRSQHIGVRWQNYQFAQFKKIQSNIDIYIYADNFIKGSMLKTELPSIMVKKLKKISLGRDYEKIKRNFHRRITFIKVYNFATKLTKCMKKVVKTIKGIRKK